MYKKKIGNSFNKAANKYEKYAILQKISGKILMSKIKIPKNKFILDAGCGTGLFSLKLLNIGNTIVALDLSKSMLNQAKKNKTANYYIQGDIEHLPLLNNTFHICWSNLSLQWCSDFSKAILELYRVTKLGGKIVFSTIGNGSLLELKNTWSLLDNFDHVNDFLSVKDIVNSCSMGKLKIYEKYIQLTFPNIKEALLSIKCTGANYIKKNRKKNMLTRKDMIFLESNWPKNNNGYILSYNLIFGIIVL
ncbi:malonyl-ACP O-methyltransferase BioC [Buchnera aphidicola (Neophyllaphis podocarpi)]|uniref:malonyl-ACP O-methyltransferase BioC n=1 Tax=Buchnera aphidicola TaxID=9 RepID=UPI0031B8A3FD